MLTHSFINANWHSPKEIQGYILFYRYLNVFWLCEIKHSQSVLLCAHLFERLCFINNIVTEAMQKSRSCTIYHLSKTINASKREHFHKYVDFFFFMFDWLFLKCFLDLTIFSSCPGGFLRKRQRGAKLISTIPIMVISQGKPMLSAMAPPMDGPAGVGERRSTCLYSIDWLVVANR